MIAAVILAAGKSERMGEPKALLRFRGKTFLEHIHDALLRSSIRYTVIVVGHHREAIAAANHGLSLTFNPNYEQGMSTSVQTGIRALAPHVSGAAIFLVDHPMVDAATIDELAAHLKPGRIVLPVYRGRRGHPVLFAADLFPEILSLSPDQGLNAVVHRDPGRVISVTVDAPAVLQDIDTPEQFRSLLGENN